MPDGPARKAGDRVLPLSRNKLLHDVTEPRPLAFVSVSAEVRADRRDLIGAWLRPH
jgi:hypothetical protein